jgi:uncharacterized protein YfdQ (DUF2303 family)
MNDTTTDKSEPEGEMLFVHEGGVHGSVIKQTIELLDEHRKASIVMMDLGDDGQAPIVIRPNGATEIMPADAFDDYLAEPRRREGEAVLLDLSSFIDHANRFSDEDSIVFADNDRRDPSLCATFDYHRAGHDSAPRFGRHTSKFAFPLSDEWKAWRDVDKEPMKMREFAAFLEDRIIDVLPAESRNLNDDQKRYVDNLGGERRIAEPAKLIELSNGLQVFEESEVSSAVRLQTGEAKMTFANRHTDGQGGDLNVPSMFVIGIPVFQNGPEYQILVRLRYRKVGADLVFFTETWRTDRVFDHAFDEALDRVRDETGLPVLLGHRES